MVKSKESSTWRKSFGITGALSLRRRYGRLQEQYRRFYGRRDIGARICLADLLRTSLPLSYATFSRLRKNRHLNRSFVAKYLYEKNIPGRNLSYYFGARYKNKSANKGFIVMKLPCFTMLVTNVSAFRVPHRAYRGTFSRLGRYPSHEDILRRESLCESFSPLVRIDHARARAKSRKNFYCRPRTILHT